jgi:hypothetical protein
METKKSAAISALILSEVSKGKTVFEALDAVCGAGTAARLVDDLCDALRAELGRLLP